MMWWPAAALLLAAGADAYSSFKDALPNGHQVRNCDNNLIGGVGHKTQCPHGDCLTKGGGVRNAFGEDFAAAGFKWTTELCQKDSDGDGKSNGLELGDPDCTWKKGETPKVDTGITHPGEDCAASVCTGNDWLLPGQSSLKEESFLKPSDSNKVPPGCGRYQHPDTSMTFETLFPGTHTIPPGTAYLKMGFNAPDDVEPMMVTKFENIIESNTVLHHMILFRCTYDVTDQFDFPKPGRMPCIEEMMVWAIGGSDFCAPENIGFLVKPGDHFALEVHYDNPRHIAGIIDKSGMILHGVPQKDVPNMITAKTWMIGPSARPRSLTIPPGIKEYRVRTFMDPLVPADADQGIEVFAYLQHQHLIGRRQWLIAEKPDGMVEEVFCDTEYNFDLQETRYFPIYYKIDPGTKLTLDCVWDSTGRENDTVGGLATEEEMCFAFLYFIGYKGKSGNNQTIGYTVSNKSLHEISNDSDKMCGCPYGFVYEPIDTSSNRISMILAHGLLMIFAWGFLVPLGVAFPMTWRKVLPEWFHVHQSLQLGGALCTLVGFILAVMSVQSNHFSPSVPHKTFGLVIFLLAMLQVIGGMMRPDKVEASDETSPAAKKRTGWLLFHRVAAILLIFSSSLQCIGGSVLFAQYAPGVFSTDGFILCLAGGWLVCIIALTAGHMLEGRKVVFNSGAARWEKQVDEGCDDELELPDN